MNGNVVVVGTQWGDEGKCKVVDLLTHAAQGVVRFQGGHNAGHTLVIGGRGSEFRLREYDLGGGFEGQALHAGQFELYLDDGARCRLVHLQDWGSEPAQVHEAPRPVPAHPVQLVQAQAAGARAVHAHLLAEVREHVPRLLRVEPAGGVPGPHRRGRDEQGEDRHEALAGGEALLERVVTGLVLLEVHGGHLEARAGAQTVRERGDLGEELLVGRGGVEQRGELRGVLTCDPEAVEEGGARGGGEHDAHGGGLELVLGVQGGGRRRRHGDTLVGDGRHDGYDHGVPSTSAVPRRPRSPR